MSSLLEHRIVTLLNMAILWHMTFLARTRSKQPTEAPI